MLESGRIRLVRPSAVSINHKKLAHEPTLENFIHKDRRRNVGCVHHSRPFKSVIGPFKAVLSRLSWLCCPLGLSWSLFRYGTANILKTCSFLFRPIQFVSWLNTENCTQSISALRHEAGGGAVLVLSIVNRVRLIHSSTGEPYDGDLQNFLVYNLNSAPRILLW
jgi:hypothetical protein